MSDQCQHCTVRGDLDACLRTYCYQHESWFAKDRRKRIEALEAENESLLVDAARYRFIREAKNWSDGAWNELGWTDIPTEFDEVVDSRIEALKEQKQ